MDMVKIRGRLGTRTPTVTFHKDDREVARAIEAANSPQFRVRYKVWTSNKTTKRFVIRRLPAGRMVVGRLGFL
jgi:acyl-CoA reductase-like NAD-dependent aldehyde dehydrogenase